MKYKLLLILFVIAWVTSIVLSSIPISQICDPTQGCDVVQHSPYASTLGIKNSYYGVAVFLLGSILIFSHIQNPKANKRKIIHLLVIVGALISLYFIYIQEFILSAYCKYCMVVDISMLVALLVIIWKWKE